MTQPNPLPPTVAELRDTVMRATCPCWTTDARNALDELCRRAAAPAPVADEAAIKAWESESHPWTGSDYREWVRRGAAMMRAAPRNDDGRLRKLREEMQAEWLECIENKKQFPVGSGDRRECQAEANAFQSACFRIDRLLAESPAGDAGESGSRKQSFDPHGVAGKLRLIASGLTYNEGKAEGVAKHWIYEVAWRIQAGLDHVPDEKRMRGQINDLRARLQAAEADLAAAKSIYREHWDDCETVAEMMRSACNEAVTRLAQFKDRGGIIDKLEADLAAAQKERDVAVTGARDFRAAWEREKRWREDDRAAAKAEGARAVVEIPQEIVEWAELWAKGPQADNWPCRTAKWILSLRAAQPQPTTAAPATVRQGDDRLSDRPACEEVVRTFNPVTATPSETWVYIQCRRALEGKP